MPSLTEVSWFLTYNICRPENSLNFRAVYFLILGVFMSLSDFSMPVHKSFQQADLLLGVPKAIFLMLFLLFMLVTYLFGLILGISITVVFYIPCFILTKHDPHMLTVALNSLTEPDRLEG